MHPPEGPPICTALKRLPSRMPPPMPKMTSRSVSPIGISTRPPRRILPVRANTLVPFEFSVPIAANFAPPFRMIQATLAKVSTLLMLEGLFR